MLYLVTAPVWVACQKSRSLEATRLSAVRNVAL